MSMNVKCGYIDLEGERSPVYCNTETGDCFFRDPIMSDPRLVYGIEVTSPVEVDDHEADEGCIGMIHTVGGVYRIVSENRAEYVSDAGEIRGIEIDLYSDYDGELDDEGTDD